MKPDFLIRLRSSVILMTLAILSFYFGGLALFLMLLFVSICGLMEFYRGAELWKTPMAAAGIMGSCLYLEALWLGWDSWLVFVLFLALLMVLGTFVFTFPKATHGQAAAAIFGVLYVPFCLSFLFRIRNMEEGFYLVWLVFLASWGCDTLAYVSGLLLGKHKMTPVLSPKKTWEGAMGGVLGSALLGWIYALIFQPHLSLLGNPLLALPLICALGAMVSQIGDLAASAFKRSFGIKDFGTLIPGHGGILDRFDSVIITAPLIYYGLLLLQAVS